MKAIETAVVAVVVVASAGVAAAQSATAAMTEADQKQSRYQIGQMERVLEGAVEHGVTNIRDRLQALGPTEMLLSDNARARGFRLEGYGVFFDVVVPSFDTTVLWSIRTLDQNDLGLENALKALEAHVNTQNDVNLRQALRRVELQMNPMLVGHGDATVAVSSAAAAVPAPSSAAAVQPQVVDSILSDPDEAYRSEVTHALMDALLDHSSSLGLQPDEWLTIAARRNDARPRLAPADSDARTFILRLRGADLAAFLARQISREEALKRIEVRVF